MPVAMAKPLKPIGRAGATLADVAYQRISDAMLAGDIAPGTRLVMDQLAEQLDISRTPVRDALLRLEHEGLIEPSGRRGYVVRAIGEGETLYLYEAREAIEGFAARRVAEIGSPAIERVRAVVAASESVEAPPNADPRAAYEANMRIHRAVVEAAGNPILVSLFEDVWQRARGLVIFADYIAHRTSPESTLESHLPLVEALSAGPDEAFAAMRAHIRRGHRGHRGLDSLPVEGLPVVDGSRAR